MKRVTVTVERAVVDTWHYIIEVDDDFPESADGLDAREAGNANSTIYDIVTSGDEDRIVSDALLQSDCTSLDIVGWNVDVDGGAK